MSRRRNIEAHLHAFDEIDKVMSSMKNLALLATRKLAARCVQQQALVGAAEQMLEDLQRAYPLPDAGTQTLQVVLLIGSERGFCGDYNQTLLAAMQPYLTAMAPLPEFIAVGSKLATRTEDLPASTHWISGASVEEEIPAVINAVVAVYTQLQRRFPADTLPLVVFFPQQERKAIAGVQILPPEVAVVNSTRGAGFPPLLNLPAEQMFAELLDHYLYAKLHEIFYRALLAENEQRIHHLSGALQRIEQQAEALRLKRNSLRQEEITEEIEVILLSVENLMGDDLVEKHRV